MPIGLVNKFAKMEKTERSWYMKNDLFYFVVSTPKSKYTFARAFEETVNRWVSAFKQCLDNVKMYPDSISCFNRNDSVIQDMIVKDTEGLKRKNSKNSSSDLMTLFTSQLTSES